MRLGGDINQLPKVRLEDLLKFVEELGEIDPETCF